MKKLMAILLSLALSMMLVSTAGATGVGTDPTDRVLKFTITRTTDGSAAIAYQNITDAITGNYTYQAGDTLEYDVWLSNGVAGLGAIDIETAGGTQRDNGAVDQNGISAHPNADISSKASQAWYHRKIGIVNQLIGQRLSNVLIAAEMPSSAPSTVYALYKNIVITRNGSTVFEIFTNNTDLNSTINNVKSVTLNNATVSFSVIAATTDASTATTTTGFFYSDNINAWSTDTSNGKLSLDTSSKTEGSASLKLDVTNGVFLFRNDSSEVDNLNLTGKKYLAFDIYVSAGHTDIFSGSGDCGINFTSDGTWDGGGVHVTAKDLKALSLKAGWNSVCVPITYESNYTAKISSITQMRLYETANHAGATYLFDNFRVLSSLPENSTSNNNGSGNNSQATVKKDTSLMWNDCDSYDSFFGDSEDSFRGLDTDVKTQGTSSIKWVNDSGNIHMVYWKQGSNVDVSKYEYIEFDLWVPKANFFTFTKDASIEVTSGNQCDVGEMSWNPKTLKLVEGWNHIKLKFSSASFTQNWKGVKDIDLTHINYLRIYGIGATAYAGQKLTWRLDNIRFTSSETVNTGVGAPVSAMVVAGLAAVAALGFRKRRKHI